MMSDIEARKPIHQRWFCPWIVGLLAVLGIHFSLSNPSGLFASGQKEPLSGAAPAPTACVSKPDPSLSLRCVSFSGHLYAVADIDLRLQKIVFTVSDNGKRETLPEVAGNLS